MKPKTHLRHANQHDKAICGNTSHKRGGPPPPLTSSMAEVTCKGCLKIAGNKTHAGGGGDNRIEVTVRKHKNGDSFMVYVGAEHLGYGLSNEQASYMFHGAVLALEKTGHKVNTKETQLVLSEGAN